MTVREMLSAQIVFAAVIALVAAAFLARSAARDLCVARMMRDEARALLAGRGVE